MKNHGIHHCKTEFMFLNVYNLNDKTEFPLWIKVEAEFPIFRNGKDQFLKRKITVPSLSLGHNPPCVLCVPYVFYGDHGRCVFLKTWGGSSKRTSSASCKCVARTPRQAVCGCVHRTLRTW